MSPMILWNGGSSDPQGYDPEGCRWLTNITQGHGRSMGPGDLDPPELAVCHWTMHVTSLSLGFLCLWRSNRAGVRSEGEEVSQSPGLPLCC